MLDLGPMTYLMVDGKGAPESPDYARAVQALFAVSYTIKFISKNGPSTQDYTVMPLEGLWWADGMAYFTTGPDKTQWQWTMLIHQPDFISAADIAMALKAAAKKKSPPDTSGLQLESSHERPCAQILHIGPFDDEGPTIARLHEEIEAAGYQLSGKHHEAYLSDIRRAAPEKWRTILRQPHTVR